MSSIGGSTLTITDGIPFKSAGSFDAFVRPGLAGTGVYFHKPSDEPQSLTTLALFADQSSATTAADAYRAMQGTTVTVIDQFGRTWNNVAIGRVVATISECIHPDTPWCAIARWDIVLET